MRTVLISGGTRGIGLATAEAFRKAGDRVFVTHRDGEPPPGFDAVRCDVTSATDVESAFQHIEAESGPVDVVVANAGVTQDQLLLRLKDEDFAALVDVNLMGAVRLARRSLRRMVRNRFGRIILVSSATALTGSPGQTNYAATKSALIGFGRSLAREVGTRGITVNVVAPGWIDTDMTRSLPKEQLELSAQQVPLGRVGSAEEVAGVIRFLASEEASYVTGTVLPVDGGVGMGH